jgi:Type IV secretion-system coupling protein DNA-binding domain
MSASLAWYELTWPREVSPDQVVGIFRLLAGGGGEPVVIEAIGSAGHVKHRLALPSGHGEGVIDQLRASLPGLAIVEVPDRPALSVSRAVELRLSTRQRALRVENMANISRSVLTALAQVHRNECLVLQWVLARSLPALAVANRLDGLGPESWISALLLAPFDTPRPPDTEVRNALRLKQSEPGWQAIGRIGVNTSTRSRQRQLVSQLVGALRSAEAPSVRFWVRVCNPKHVIAARAGWRRPLRLNVAELAAISSFPVGATSELPVSKVGSRLLPPAAAIHRKGLVIGRASYPGRERPIAITAKDARRHIHLLGPSGVGKSTLLLHLVSQTIADGRAVVVIEPKGDLIAECLRVIPAERMSDVVLIDPSDHERPVGLNPLVLNGRSPELVADQLLGLWHAMYASSWGPRTADILGASLLTLARTPGMTIAALPVLLTNPSFRRRIVARVSDPIGLGPFWATYEGWSEPERITATAPVMNKLRPLLMRPELRNLLGQRSGFDVRRVFKERKILLVNLNKGLLGPETSALLGSLIVSMLWQAILGRSSIPPERRHPALVVVDEFQDYLHLPLDFADALAQARGLGAGFALAHQYLHQFSPAMRSAVLANAQSRVAFRLPNDDAKVLAAGGLLSPEDFQSLGAYEAYAQVVASEAVQPWCSVKTLPPPAPVSDAAAVRAASREAHGVGRAQVEAELHKLFAGGRSNGHDDLAPRKRSPEAER